MLRSTKVLEGARIHAIDGDIGHVEEFYFDDRNWRIKYVVTNIGNWLHGKLVLMSPEAITSVEGDDEPIINVALTKEQVRQSLDAQTHRPVSLQQPHDYYLYLGLPHYLNVPTLSDPDADAHLRSSKIVGRYHIMAIDGEIGHLEGFIIDDEPGPFGTPWPIPGIGCTGRKYYWQRSGSIGLVGRSRTPTLASGASGLVIPPSFIRSDR